MISPQSTRPRAHRFTSVSRLALTLTVALTFAGCGSPDRSGDVAVVAEGSFVDKGGQQTSGSFRIERAGDDLRLVLSDDFRTDEGPDLHIVLSPTDVAAAESENAMAEGAEVVSELRSLEGGQEYDLRDDLDLTAFRSVVIHCIEFTHLYGAAPLA